MIQVYIYSLIISIIITNCVTLKVLSITIMSPNCSCQIAPNNPSHNCSAKIRIDIKVNPRQSDKPCEAPPLNDEQFCPTCVSTNYILFNQSGTIGKFTESPLPFQKDFPNDIGTVYVYMYLKTKKDPTVRQSSTPSPFECKTYDNEMIWTRHSMNPKSIVQRCDLQFRLNYSCAANYYGENCDVFCQPNNGSFGHYICDEYGGKICLPHYLGENCSQYDFCSSSPCYNGGNCSNLIKYYSCECPSGFTGRNCSMNIDECLSNPCKNGSCHDEVNSFLCTCDSDYTGITCDVKIDDCNETPCVHGECIDGINNYTCECEEGYTGRNCNQSVDDCVGNMCMNGTCLDLHNNYSCTCDPDFTGSHCDRRIDDCLNNSCVYGSCIDGTHYPVVTNNGKVYTCSCDFGYTGTFCNTTISTPDTDFMTLSTKDSTTSSNFTRSMNSSRNSELSTTSTKRQKSEHQQPSDADFFTSTNGKIVVAVISAVVVLVPVSVIFLCYMRNRKYREANDTGRLNGEMENALDIQESKEPWSSADGNFTLRNGSARQTESSLEGSERCQSIASTVSEDVTHL